MMRSMFTGVSGLRTHQGRMDVVAHNIANVNTVGFKASRMTFAETFSQTLQGASGPNADTGRGGTNPQQIGLGVGVSSIQRLMSTGGAQRTDDPFHLMIEGNGFFVVGDDVGGLFFTRAGDFQQDVAGNIHLNGLRLQGWRAPWQMGGPMRDAAGDAMPISSGPVSGIQISQDMQSVPPRATGNVQFAGNMDPAGSPHIRSMNFHDSLGQVYQLNLRFTEVTDAASGATHWTVERANSMIRTSSVPNQTLNFDGTGEWTATGLELRFDTAGYPILVDPPPPAPPTTNLLNAFTWYFQIETIGPNPGITLPNGDHAGANFIFGQNFEPIAAAPPNSAGGPATAGNYIRVCFRGLTAFRGDTRAASHDVDGMEAGDLIGLSIGPDGVIRGTYSNGQDFALWQIALANFANPAGLMAMGSNLFAATSNSGLFDGVGSSPAGLGTRLLGGTLEMSNVDIAAEFTEMITTQRGFQANSRVISTSDEILQELVNLRR